MNQAIRRKRNVFFRQHPVILKCLAEFFGTFLLVFSGLGVVGAAVLVGSQSGLWQVAVVWGFGITIAILCTQTNSGAHLNPAVTLAFALLRPETFDNKLILPYWISQVLGAMSASLVNYGFLKNIMDRVMNQDGLERGDDGSEAFAMVFGMYFPNPREGLVEDDISIFQGLGVEVLGTAILMLVILAVTDPKNPGANALAPFWIGFTVAVLISIQAPLDQAGYNPARDFGPRLAALMIGFGDIAIPGPRGAFWVYILGPFIGAPLGGIFYDVFLAPLDPIHESEVERNEEKEAKTVVEAVSVGENVAEVEATEASKDI